MNTAMDGGPLYSNPAFMAFGGEVASLIRARDWSTSPLGEPGTWPQPLVQAVNLILSSRLPMFLAWGPELGFLYNDAYAVILAEKHPAALGGRFQEIWPEIWPDLLPLVQSALRGEPVYHENQHFVMNRKGFDEETWFTFSYSAVVDDGGTAQGIFCAVVETTQTVLAERALRDSEARLSLAVEGARIGTWDWDLRTMRGDWSPRTMEILGASHGTGITPEQRSATIHPDDRGRVWREYAAALKDGSDLVSEYRIVRPSGEVRWIASRGAVERDACGTPVRTAGIVVDVTESKAAEAALRESEERFRLMADAAPLIMWITDGEGRTEFFNRQWTIYTGDEYQASTAHRIAGDYVHPDDAAETTTAFDAARSAETTFLIEHRIRSRSGAYRWFLVRAEPYHDPHTGAVTRWFGASVDIHDRKLAEARLRALNETLEVQVAARSAERERLWNLSQDMLARADFTGMMSAVSPAWGQVLGWSEAELLSRGYASFMHPEDADPTLQAITRMQETGRPTRFRNRISASDGTFKPIEWTVTPEPDGINFIAIGRDLSETQAREDELEATQDALRQAQKMEAVGQLTGGLAHDFNNLLMGVSGALSLITRRVEQGRVDELGKYLEMAEAGISRAASLTHRLLAFSRRQTLDPRPVDLRQVIQGIGDFLQRSVGPSVAVEIDGGDEVWPTLLDANQFENALLNLCINARDAMPEGGTVRIATENCRLEEGFAEGEEAADCVLVSVTDTGSGMDAQTLERAFDPFYTTKPTGEGTGLGLSMVYGFVRQSGGQVRIRSAVGQGTTVELRFPRTLSAQAADDRVAPASARPANSHGETVMVVDDEVVIRSLVTEVLRDMGYNVIEAADGVQALALLQSSPPLDLLITDVGLPNGVNGRQLADAARSRQNDLRVLFITGYAENAVIGESQLDAGMHLLTKPFEMDALTARVQELVAGP
ncbi:PAS domain S-box protein [Parafrankia sp. BMG5.11]|uniref:PAS domain S-box protein n=1 Tax=Parafrankia sp. BMG5.11 TaxID=222540 RepID=UPI00103E2BFE|nr:PAS domain S-box protein [Parafrankia sp. BMG5.11]TCJ38864.1 PAS domain S-box protein [Parafrankia sp. BMG5.11]